MVCEECTRYRGMKDDMVRCWDSQLNREKLREQARRYYLRNRDRMKVARILGVSLTMIDAEGKLI